MPTFMRGARPSPRHKLSAATAFTMLKAPPAQFGVIPTRNSMKGNDQYGDCVTAEWAQAIAVYSLMCGLPQRFVTDQQTIAWAKSHGYADGANLTDVMDSAAKDFLGDDASDKNLCGAYTSVDYSNADLMNAATVVGPINLAIDANALPSGAGNQMGWYALKKGTFPNTDHCVHYSAYGRADYIYDLMKVSLPSAISPSTIGRAIYTWQTYGFVTDEWGMGTIAESWSRHPTILGLPTPVPPGPPNPPNPPNPPTPVPLGWPASATLTMADGTTQVYYPGTAPTPGGLNIPPDMLAKMQAAGIDVAKYLASLGGH